MTSLTDLVTELNSIQDAILKADKYIQAGANQTNIDQQATAEIMLNSARTIVSGLVNNYEDPDALDRLISELAFQYARAGFKSSAQTALTYVQSEALKNWTRQRIAVSISVTDLALASSIVQTITDETVKNDAISEIAIVRASADLQQALTVHNNITDAVKKEQTYYNILNKTSQTVLT